MNLRELMNIEGKKKIEYDELLNECLKEGLSFSEFKKRAISLKEDIYLMDKYRRQKMDATVQFGKKWKGTRLALAEFCKKAENGSLSDMDGTGYYSTKDGVSDIEIIPSDITEGIYRTDFPYVQWLRRENSVEGDIRFLS